MLEDLPRNKWMEIAVSEAKAQKSIEAQMSDFEQSIRKLEERFEDKVDKLQRGDELLRAS